MASGFHDGSRSLQDRFETRALADRIDELLATAQERTGLTDFGDDSFREGLERRCFDRLMRRHRCLR